MVKQETLTIFPEIEDTTKMMSNEQFGELMRAVMAYRFRGEEYAGKDVAVYVAFQFMSSQVDRCETAKVSRSRAAQARWASSGDAEDMQSDAEDMQSDADGMQSDAKPMQTNAKGMQTNAEGMQSDAKPMQSDAPILSYPIHSYPIQSNNKRVKAVKPPAPTSEVRKSYGTYGWVKLTDGEYHRLLNDLGEAEVKRCIAYIDESAQTTNNKNKWRDWNLVIRKCHRDGWGLQAKQSVQQTGRRELDSDEMEAIKKLLEG